MFGKKYKLMDETYYIGNRAVHPIRALKSFPVSPNVCVKEGDIGGFVESEKNLSQDGTCWIFDNAVVLGDATVRDKARVMGNAIVEGSAVIEEIALVCDHAHICDHARIRGISYISGNARVKHQAKVCGAAEMNGYACIGGHATLAGQAVLGGHAAVLGQMQIAGKVSLYVGMFLGSGILVQIDNIFSVSNIAPERDILFWKDLSGNIHVEYHEVDHIGLDNFALYMEESEEEPYIKNRIKDLIRYAETYYNKK